MSSLRSLIPCRLSHLIETSAYVRIKLYTPDPPGPWIQCCIIKYANLFNAKFNTVEKFTFCILICICACAAQCFGRTCTSWLIMCPYQSACQRNSLVVLQLPTGKGSQEKALRLESPPSGKHPWTTAILEYRSFAITRPPH